MSSSPHWTTHPLGCSTWTSGVRINASVQGTRRRTACSSSIPLVYAATETKITSHLDLKTRLLDAMQADGRGHNPRREPWNGALGRQGSRTFAPMVGQRAYAFVPSEPIVADHASDFILAPLKPSTSVSDSLSKGSEKSRCPSARSISTWTSSRCPTTPAPCPRRSSRSLWDG